MFSADYCTLMGIRTINGIVSYQISVIPFMTDINTFVNNTIVPECLHNAI